MKQKNNNNSKSSGSNSTQKKQSSISVIIASAYSRTKEQFQNCEQIRQEKYENVLKKKRLIQKPILIEEEIETIPQQTSDKIVTRQYAKNNPIEILESVNISIKLKPLIELKANCQKSLQLEDITEGWKIDLDQLMKTKDQIQKLKIKEKKVQQEKKFKFYTNELQQEEKLRDLDNQIDEEFSYTYNFQSVKQSSIELKYIDFTKLNSLVNDTIINFFLRFALHELVPEIQAQRFRILSTYHTAKIIPWDTVSQIDKRCIKDLADEFQKNFPTILKWTKEDTFQREFLLMPLHLLEHWSLIIVFDPKDICVQMWQSIQGGTYFQSQTKGFFLYFDSLKELDEKIIIMIKIFLLQMYCHQQGIQLSQEQILKSAVIQIPYFQPLVPRQINYVDCGVHVLEYAERFMTEPEFVLNRLKSNQWWNLLDWFPRILVVTKRLLIKRLLLNLVKNDKNQAILTYQRDTQNIYQSFSNLSFNNFFFFFSQRRQKQ